MVSCKFCNQCNSWISFCPCRKHQFVGATLSLWPANIWGMTSLFTDRTILLCKTKHIKLVKYLKEPRKKNCTFDVFHREQWWLEMHVETHCNACHELTYLELSTCNQINQARVIPGLNSLIDHLGTLSLVFCHLNWNESAPTRLKMSSVFINNATGLTKSLSCVSKAFNPWARWSATACAECRACGSTHSGGWNSAGLCANIFLESQLLFGGT